MSTFSFGKEARLLTSKDYKAVFDKADIKVSNREILMLANRNGFSFSRLGLVVAKKHVRLAVQRNRIKRIVRESFRQNSLTPGMDVIVLARKGIDRQGNPELHKQLNKLWLKLSKRAKA